METCAARYQMLTSRNTLPLHSVPPEPTPPLHHLPSLSSYQSPQTTTLAAEETKSQSRRQVVNEHRRMFISACWGQTEVEVIVCESESSVKFLLRMLSCHLQHSQRSTWSSKCLGNTLHYRGYKALKSLRGPE